MRPVSHASARGLSRTAVLALLGRAGPLTRVEISRQLGRSSGTVTQITKRLLAEGLIRETESVPSAGGRPAIRLAIVPDAGRAIGVKVALDHVTVVHVTLGGEVTDSTVHSFDAVAEDATDRLAGLLAPHAQRPGQAPLLGVGVGVPGRVGPDGIVDSPHLGWSRTPLGRLLERALGLPVLVENDVNTVGTAHLLYGHGRFLEDFLVVTLGSGVGLAVVSGGEVLRGAFGGAGELGHVPVTDDGWHCRCGNRGCLEAYVGFEGLARTAAERGVLRPGDRPEALATLAEAGETGALNVLRGAGRLLGRALAGVVNVLDPRAVIVTGEGMPLWTYLLDGFEPSFQGHRFRSHHQLELITDDWEDGMWAQGAAATVLAAPFTPAAAEGTPVEAARARLTATRPSTATPSGTAAASPDDGRSASTARDPDAAQAPDAPEAIAPNAGSGPS